MLWDSYMTQNMNTIILIAPLLLPLPCDLPNSNPFLGSTDQGSHMGFYRVDENNENNSMDEFLNSILSNQDEYYGGLNFQQMSTPEVIHSRLSSEVDTEIGIVQGDLGLHDPGWFSRDTSSALYENAILLPYDNNGPNVYSVDPGAESLQELFNSMKESNSHMSAFNNEVGLREETGISGISSTHMTAQYNLSTEQGPSRIRIRLQVGAISSTQIDSGTKKEENGGQTNVKVEDIKERDLRIKLNDLPIHDNIVASLNVEELSPSKNELTLRTRSKGITKFDKVRGPVLVLETSKSDVAMGYVTWLILSITILVLLCVGIWKWRRSQSLWISGILDGFP